MADTLKKVDIFTDGACSINPGPGGYAAILRYNGREKVFSGGASGTTNNQMELMAVITGLEVLKERCNVTIYTDSKYVVDGITRGWAKNWRENNWKKKDGKLAKNPELWERLLDLIDMHKVNFVWVKGHDGHPENERCDKIAVEESKKFA